MSQHCPFNAVLPAFPAQHSFASLKEIISCPDFRHTIFPMITPDPLNKITRERKMETDMRQAPFIQVKLTQVMPIVKHLTFINRENYFTTILCVEIPFEVETVTK